jgi:hypothetical protein
MNAARSTLCVTLWLAACSLPEVTEPVEPAADCSGSRCRDAGSCLAPSCASGPSEPDAGQREMDVAIPKEESRDAPSPPTAAGSGGAAAIAADTNPVAQAGAPASGSSAGASAGASGAPPAPAPPLGPAVEHWIWPAADSTPGAKVGPSYTFEENVVIDNVTHLVWQRVLPTTYPGCTLTSDLTENEPAGSACTFEEAQAYCESSEVAAELGGDGWRLPGVFEILTIEGELFPNGMRLIERDSFPGPSYVSYWAASSSDEPGQAASVFFGDSQVGTVGPNSKGFMVRCVRSEQPIVLMETSQHYQAGLGTVTSTHTGLTWQRDAPPEKYRWETAQRYCETLELDGMGWRLPAYKELLSLSEWSSETLDESFFPSPHDDGDFWSATESTVDFVKTVRAISHPSLRGKTDGGAVRCVR